MDNNQIQILSKVQIGNSQIPIYGTANEPLFKAADVAKVLGIENSRQMLEYVDDEEKLVYVVNTSGQRRSMNFLTEDGLYEVFFQSRKPIAKQFKKQVKTILKELRLKGEVSVKPTLAEQKSADVAANYMAAEMMSKLLGYSESSKAYLVNQLNKNLQLALPEVDYVESKGVQKCASECLKQSNYPTLSIHKFNEMACNAGILRRESRFSKKFKKYVHFWSLTEEGREYGENLVSPKNPRETQPSYYVDKFNALLKLVIGRAENQVEIQFC